VRERSTSSRSHPEKGQPSVRSRNRPSYSQLGRAKRGVWQVFSLADSLYGGEPAARGVGNDGGGCNRIKVSFLPSTLMRERERRARLGWILVQRSFLPPSSSA